MIFRYWPVEESMLNISNIAGDLLFNFLFLKKSHESLIKLASLS